MNVLKRGFAELGLGRLEDTPVDTVTVLRTEGSDGPHERSALVNATDADEFREVSARHGIETGSLPS
nr:hypothetical protein [Halobiforma nitratireducens]